MQQLQSQQSKLELRLFLMSCFSFITIQECEYNVYLCHPSLKAFWRTKRFFKGDIFLHGIAKTKVLNIMLVTEIWQIICCSGTDISIQIC